MGNEGKVGVVVNGRRRAPGTLTVSGVRRQRGSRGQVLTDPAGEEGRRVSSVDGSTKGAGAHSGEQ